MMLAFFLAANYMFPDEMAPFRRRVQLALSLDESADSNRIQRIPHNLKVISERPWLGHGLGTNHEVEPYGIAIGYMLLLIERGIIGTLLFLLPCLWALYVLGWRGERGNWYDNVALLLLVCELYCLSTFAMIYFPPYWFALGITLRCAWFRRFASPLPAGQLPSRRTIPPPHLRRFTRNAPVRRVS
jgi:O-antigen ligase